ncbi:MAG: hypothetical protein IPP52_17460 [Ignavibacteria bacterium]|nr:hypothetical protein [Ignavibacteria bacterium]
MEKVKSLLPYNEILSKWNNGIQSELSARLLTLEQTEALESVIVDDEGWEYLLSVFNNGRETDAWLALDWPDGFDELLLCVPLCSLVKFECSRCFVGMRQDNNSCANDFSLFGYIAELIKAADREGLINHIALIKKILLSEEYIWNIEKRIIEKRK